LLYRTVDLTPTLSSSLVHKHILIRLDPIRLTTEEPDLPERKILTNRPEAVCDLIGAYAALQYINDVVLHIYPHAKTLSK
jgi:hypothetical protein